MRVLISGAAIGGLTCAYWLKKFGFSPTIIERTDQLRTGGYKIDVRGKALEVLRRMGIYEEVAASSTDMQGATVVDRDGNVVAQMTGDEFGLREGEDLEIVRGDLCQILRKQVDDVEIIFGDSISAISQTSNGVHVEFEKNSARTFELVIGADGLHSNVRQLAFGPEVRFAHDLGLYLCVFSIPNYLGLDRWEMEYTDLGKIVNIWGLRSSATAKACFGFTTPDLHFDPRDVAAQKKLLCSVYDGIGWEVPRLLQEMDTASDFYFDRTIQICMDRYSEGRVVLVGDAGYCPSPMSGQGTSLALIGAYVLAVELAEASGDFKKAFTQYERILRPFVKVNQLLGIKAAKLMRSRERNSLFVWLHEQMLRLAPRRWVQFFTNRARKRIAKAANAITLKDLLK